MFQVEDLMLNHTLSHNFGTLNLKVDIASVPEPNSSSPNMEISAADLIPEAIKPLPGRTHPPVPPETSAYYVYVYAVSPSQINLQKFASEVNRLARITRGETKHELSDLLSKFNEPDEITRFEDTEKAYLFHKIFKYA